MMQMPCSTYDVPTRILEMFTIYEFHTLRLYTIHNYSRHPNAPNRYELCSVR
jgi:hypothetical protein